MATESSAVYGLRPPEEIRRLDDDVNVQPLDLIRKNYEAWLSAIEDVPMGVFSWVEANDVYKMACRCVEPLKDRLSGTMLSMDIGYMDGKAVGLYVSALLNATGLERMMIFGDWKPDLGYHLAEGKAVEIMAGARVRSTVGQRAEGGTIINQGRVDEFTWNAKNGVFVNLGSAGNFGTIANGGVFLNFGDIDVRDRGLAHEASGGTFVSRTAQKEIALGDSYVVDSDALINDFELIGLMGAVEGAARRGDVPTVNQYARTIDAHVRKSYLSRGESPVMGDKRREYDNPRGF